MLENPKSRPRWPVLQIVLALLALLIMASGLWQLRGLEKIVHQQQERFLAGILNERRDAVVNWLHGVRDDVELFASDPHMSELILELRSRLGKGSKKEAALRLRQVFDLEPASPSEKQAAKHALNYSGYMDSHDRWHSWFSALNERRGYYDLFLFDADGFLLYSVEKEDDFATNLVSGKWSGTGLGSVVQDILSNPGRGGVSLTDFEAYGPSKGDAASFIASAIYAPNGDIAGVFAVQMPRDRLNAILNASMGTKGGGRFYLAGRDGFLRTDIGGSPTLLMRRGISPFSVAGLENGQVKILNRRRGVLGTEVVIAARTLSLENVEFTIVAEFDVKTLRSWTGNSEIVISIMSVAVAVVVLLIVALAWPRPRGSHE